MRRFGLIGYPLSHSFSQKYFTDKFRQENIRDCLYENFPLEDIAGLPAVLAQYQDLAGLNITIPYKEKVIAYLHEQSPVVQEIGACNCIRFRDGKLYGYNTDVTGFQRSLEPLLLPTHRKALILGTGGASKAVEYVLRQKGIEYHIVSRSPEGLKQVDYEWVNETNLQEHTLLVNTTPLGMFPNIDSCPPIPYQFLTPAHYLFDLVYNPPVTKFLQLGQERGARIKNGADMLVIQAEESWKIWNGEYRNKF